MNTNSQAPSIEDIIAISGIDTIQPGGDAITVRMGQLAGMEPHAKTLVVASHRGHQLVTYAKTFGLHHLEAVDIDPAMVETALNAVRAQQIGAQINVCDAQALSHCTNQFDIVTNEGAVGIPDSPLLVLKEMFRVCKPKGKVVFRESFWRIPQDDTIEKDAVSLCYGSHLFTIMEWKSLIEQCGGVALSVEVDGWDRPDIFWKVRRERDVQSYQEIFTATEKMLVGKKIMKKYGMAGMSTAKQNEDTFYQAVLNRKIGYAIFLAEKK